MWDVEIRNRFTQLVQWNTQLRDLVTAPILYKYNPAVECLTLTRIQPCPQCDGHEIKCTDRWPCTY